MPHLRGVSGRATPDVGAFLQLRRGDDGCVEEVSLSVLQGMWVAKLNPHTCCHHEKTTQARNDGGSSALGPHLAAEIRRNCAKGDERLWKCREKER